MKREDIYDAMNWIDDEFVVNAETIKKRGGISMKRKKTIAICTAAVILADAAFQYMQVLRAHG